MNILWTVGDAIFFGLLAFALAGLILVVVLAALGELWSAIKACWRRFVAWKWGRS